MHNHKTTITQYFFMSGKENLQSGSPFLNNSDTSTFKHGSFSAFSFLSLICKNKIRNKKMHPSPQFKILRKQHCQINFTCRARVLVILLTVSISEVSGSPLKGFVLELKPTALLLDFFFFFHPSSCPVTQLHQSDRMQ